ncbi:MAG: restriction endonuclease, partial [Planctomycetes bacterium]|nr:restriction endonuclease [Planctomycetota bacterium]
SPDMIPTVTEVKYVQTRDEYQEKNLSQAQLNKLYDSVLYQIALRTIHELYEADVINGLQSVVFNGYVTSIDPATGQEATSCVFSIQAKKEEFEQINLANIDPKACFIKKLRGVGSSKLHSLTPIAPIVQINKNDRRFVSSYDVTSELDDNHNLAAMDWEDFEHLIREIFEKEFSIGGGEVKVTQASRDGGVDAVAFDPDPIRGGKVVIQAKRYTNTVGVSAVRDLYGTVMNEGANKGILVTTADYGPDAYSFARGKPLTLLNGNELLYLLEKHGHSFKIDLKEAKKILADKEKE